MLVNGPCGPLEALHDRALEPRGIQAVLCHPHPRFGGSLHDAVLDCLTRILLENGIGVLRFNFRGVGGSAGAYDDGRGEVDDLLAAADWLHTTFPGEPLWLGGYSFGAWIAWQALDRDLVPERVLLVAPPASRMNLPQRAPAIPVDVIIGDADDFADPAALARWSGVSLHRIPGADHFFSGRMPELADRLRRAVGVSA